MTFKKRLEEELKEALTGYKCPHCGKPIEDFFLWSYSSKYEKVVNGYRMDFIIECPSCRGMMMVVTVKEQLAYDPKIMSIHPCEVDFKVEDATWKNAKP